MVGGGGGGGWCEWDWDGEEEGGEPGGYCLNSPALCSVLGMVVVRLDGRSVLVGGRKGGVDGGGIEGPTIRCACAAQWNTMQLRCGRCMEQGIMEMCIPK